MSKPCQCSVAIFTFNEELNISHCLESLSWCDDVVVIDSFSQDNTCAIASKHGARTFQHRFTGFGDQRMWALETVNFHYDWVLILDADERVTPELAEEIRVCVDNAGKEVGAYQLKRRFYWEGKCLLKANLYPTWVVRLIKKGRVTYQNRGHAETQQIDGTLNSLSNDLVDENHKGLEDWRRRQLRYAYKEAVYEARTIQKLGLQDLGSTQPLMRRAALKRLARFLPFRGALYFIYSYILRGGFKDGWIGLKFCFEKSRYQQLIQRLAQRQREKRNFMTRFDI